MGLSGDRLEYVQHLAVHWLQHIWTIVVALVDYTRLRDQLAERRGYFTSRIRRGEKL